jgi:uncharacterized membrane protein YhaH (DUF805 family)
MFLVGAALTLLTAYAIGVRLFGKLALPRILLFALGATVESVLVYLFLLDHLVPLLPILFLFIPCLFFVRPKPFSEPAIQPLDSLTRWILFPLLAFFALDYLVYAMAPEIQPDAISYHLGLTAEYLRTGGFPHRVGFYEILPQGLEMLFAVAYSIGRDSAAKLVHFAFLLATLPLIVLTARRLKLTDAQGYTAAALYFFAPVVGLSGTCAYNDAALVFVTLCTFYLLLLWQNSGLTQYAACAGITAGFCYAIKFTGLLVVPLALVFLLWKRRALRPTLQFSGCAFLMIAPWMLRALLLTRNPVAPLLNSLFPNLYFNPVTERNLAHALGNYPGFHWPTALWAWAISGPTQSVAGPLILAAPLALLAWRKPAGRLLLAASVLLFAPVAFNVGTRFLMPALPFLALTLAIAIPRSALVPLALLQAVVCFPPVILHLEKPQSWALKGFPWRAALRLQPETEYLASATGEYLVARFVETHTTPQDRVFALNGIPTSFTTREVLEYWHSNRAVRYTAALQSAFANALTVSTRAEWPPVLLRSIRFISTADLPREWSIYDVRLFSPGGFLYNSPQWSLRASPNSSDAPAAFDGNRTTFWTSRVPQQRGMFLEADFDHPQLLDSVQFLIAANAPQPGFAIEGLPAKSKQWQLLTDRFEGKVNGRQDLRREAIYGIHRAGFSVISVYSNGEGLGAIGRDMTRHPRQWSLEDLGGHGDFHLMRIIEP